MRIVRIVAVHRRVGCRADRYGSVRGEAHQNHRYRQQNRVQQDTARAVGVPNTPAQGGQKSHREENHTQIDRKPQRIDTEEIEHRSDVDRVGDDQVVDKDQDGPSDQRGQEEPLPGNLLRAAEVVDEDQGRDGQQVQQVDADREAHQVGD